MGIKNLYKFILTNNLEKIEDFKDFDGKIIAIDISILLYQVVISTRGFSGTDHTDPQGEISTHILGLFNKTINLLKRNIIPVYVFDGKPPELKNKVLEARKLIRKKARIKLYNAVTEEEKRKYLKRCVSISKKQLNDCRNLLDIMGIPYIDAPQEADSQCSYLAKNNLVDGVMTEDMDILTFGAPLIVKYLYSHRKKPTSISSRELLEKIDLNYDEFIEWCCLLGSDYCKGVYELKANDILDIYKKFKNLDKTIEYLKEKNYNVSNLDDYYKVKEYFLNPLVREVNIKDLKFKEVNIKKLNNFMIKKFGFNKSKLNNKFKFLSNRNNKLFKKNYINV